MRLKGSQLIDCYATHPNKWVTTTMAHVHGGFQLWLPPKTDLPKTDLPKTVPKHGLKAAPKTVPKTVPKTAPLAERQLASKTAPKTDLKTAPHLVSPRSVSRDLYQERTDQTN